MLVYDVKSWTKKDSGTSFSGGYMVFLRQGCWKFNKPFFGQRLPDRK